MIADQLDQKRSALRTANDIRVRRARLKRTLRTQPNTIEARKLAAPIVLDPPFEAESMKLIELLTACRGVGEMNALRLLAKARVPGLTPLRELNGPDRAHIALLLRTDCFGKVAA